MKRMRKSRQKPSNDGRLNGRKWRSRKAQRPFLRDFCSEKSKSPENNPKPLQMTRIDSKWCLNIIWSPPGLFGAVSGCFLKISIFSPQKSRKNGLSALQERYFRPSNRPSFDNFCLIFRIFFM